MPIYSYTSTNIEELINQLNKTFNKYHSNFWEPLYIVVPNYNVQNFLMIQLSKKKNIIANVHYIFWDHLIAHYLKKIHLLTVKIQPRHMTILQLMKQINILLQQKNEHVQPLQRYLNYTNKGIQQREIYNLSNFLLEIFQDLHIHRPDILENWLERSHTKTYISQNQKHIEYIQRTIYKNLFKMVEIDGSNVHAITKSHLLYHLNNFVSVLPPPSPSMKKLFVFPITTLSWGYVSLLHTISNHYHLSLYQLEQIPLVDNTKLSCTNIFFKTLQLLEKICTERSEITIVTSSLLAQKPFQKTLLSQIQNLNQKKITIEQITTINNDSSLIFLQAENMFQEIQSIYNSILFQTKKQTTLYHNIAILTYDLETYLPIIDKVFASQRLKIPYVCLEPQIKTSQVFRFLMDYLSLIENSWNETNFINLLSNPTVQKSLSLTTKDIGNIQRFLKTTNTKYQSLQKDQMQHSFSFLLKRLVLSIVYPTDFDNIHYTDTFLFSVDNHIPYTNLSLQSEEFRSMFVAILRRLLYTHDIIHKEIGHSKIYSIENDLDFFCSFDLLDEHEKTCFKQVKDTLQFLKEEEQKRVLYIEEIQVFVQELSKNYKVASHGKNLTGGVIVGTIEFLYQVPFDTLYIIGVHEQAFSSPQETSFYLNNTFSKQENSQTLLAKLSKVNRLDLLESFTLYTIQQTHKRVIISYCKYNQKGNKFSEAPILKELKKLVQTIPNSAAECVLSQEMTKSTSKFQEFLLQEIPEYWIQAKKQFSEYFFANINQKKNIILEEERKNIKLTVSDLHHVQNYLLSPFHYLLKVAIKKTDIEYYEKINYPPLELKEWQIPTKEVIVIITNTIRGISKNPEKADVLTRTMHKSFLQIMKQLRLQSKIPHSTTMFWITRKKFLDWCFQLYEQLNIILNHLDDKVIKKDHLYSYLSSFSYTTKRSFYKYQDNTIFFNEPYLYYSKNNDTVHLIDMIFLNKITYVKEIFQIGILSTLQQYALQNSTLHKPNIKNIVFHQIIVNQDLNVLDKTVTYYRGEFLYPLSKDETSMIEKIHEYMMQGSFIYFNLEQLYSIKKNTTSEITLKSAFKKNTFGKTRTTHNMMDYLLQKYHDFFTKELIKHQGFSKQLHDILQHRSTRDTWLEQTKKI